MLKWLRPEALVEAKDAIDSFPFDTTLPLFSELYSDLDVSAEHFY
jgi:hypothetical protein